MKTTGKRPRSGKMFLIVTLLLGISSCVEQVLSLPTDANSANSWPSFHKRNIAALAREGYVKSGSNGYKRSISTLAKNGQLPTFRSPYDESDNQEDEDETHEKRNIASIARLRSFASMKRNIQALARDGYRSGRGGQYPQQSDKRNIQSLARNGFVFKRGDQNVDEYYYPFYQNSIPPLSEVDGPIDFNELYDLQQSINPDLLPPLSQVFKRSSSGDNPENYGHYDFGESNVDWYKRGTLGLPVHGVFRSTFVEPNSRSKRYILSLPDAIDHNDIPRPDDDDVENQDKRSVDSFSDVRDNFQKRHIGSLARLGLLPSFRFAGGRYSRSGRARLLLPSQELYRKHSHDENFGIREYIPSAEIESTIDSDDTDLPPAPLSANSHPTGRILHRPLNNDLPPPPQVYAAPIIPTPKYIDALSKNRWHSETKEVPRFYYFRSLKVPYHESGKRYLLLPAVDNIMLRKTYPNSSLPSRRKNQ